VSALRSTRLVGREAEQRELDAAVESARRGRPSALLVEGEAGIGKTRLVTDAIERLTTPEDVVLVGHGVEMAGGEMPFGVVTSALRDLIRREGLDTVRARAGAGTEPLGALVPELSSESSDRDRNRIIDAFVTVVDDLSRERLTWFVVEDLQWADISSRDLLGYLVRVVDAPAHLLVSCTLRTHDKRRPLELSTYVEGLARSRGVSRITLQRLGRDDVAAHLTSLLDEPAAPALLDRVVALSEGNPFFTEELVLWGSHGGSLPDSVTAMMSARVESLSPSAQHLVRTASLGEGDVRHAALKAVCALADQDFTAALVEAFQASVLEGDQARGDYQFRHALLREAVAGSLLPEERVNGHRRWAEELDAEADASGDVLTRIRAAHHWAETGDQDRAFDAALEAADWAHSVGAEAERATLLSRALGSWHAIHDAEARAGMDRDDLLEEAVWAHMWAGTLTAASELVDAELLLNRDDADARARRLHLQHTRDWIGGELAEAEPGRSRGVRRSGWPSHERIAPTLRESIALISDVPRSKLFVRVVTDLAANSHDAAMALELEDLMAEAVDVVEHNGTALDRFVVQNELAHLWWLVGRREPAVSVLVDMLPSPQELPLSAAIMWANNTMGRLAGVGRLRDAVRLGADTLRRAGNPELAPRLWSVFAAHLAVIYVDLGRWEEAERLRSRAASAPAWSDLYAGLMRCWSGDIRGAEDLLDHAGQAQPGWSDRSARVPELERSLLEAQIALATGDVPRARAALRSIYSSHEYIGDGDMWRILLLAARVEADDAQRHSPRRRGSPSAGAQRMDEIQRAAMEAIRAGDLGEAWTAQLAAERSRFEGSTESDPWAAAVNAWARTGHVHEQAWALVRLAECHLAAGDNDDARKALQQAVEIGERLGAAPLVDAAAAVSRRGRLGVHAPTAVDATTVEERSRQHGLTARETEVLQLVADGLSNDQIAKELFISPKTASVHVSRILAKLGVASRSEATTFAHRASLLERT
jgi:DNA-binding CsgD family transcriptional regulator